MQTVIQVITTGHGSLREKIMTDPRLEKFGLIPTEHQRPGRPHGWAKIHGEKAHGAINLEWHGPSGTLICRVVTVAPAKVPWLRPTFHAVPLVQVSEIWDWASSCAPP